MTVHAAPVISYGTTLARKLNDVQTMTMLSRVPAERVVGSVHVAVCYSHVPNVLNVECWMDGMGPATSIVGLQVAEKRLRTLHQMGPERLQFQAVDLYDAEALRRTAERLVDYCRAGRMNPGGQVTFDQPRENCVRVAMAELARAATAPAALNGD